MDLITRETRQNVIDWMRAERLAWAGRLGEEQFLDRVVDLDRLPSTDARFDTARQDIAQHRELNLDWPDDWVYSYSPLSLLDGSDELFVRFVTQMLHPVVRPEAEETRRLAGELNDLLARDGVELYESELVGRRPVWGIRVQTEVRAPADQLSIDNQVSTALNRIWERDGLLRLFLSHVSAHKAEVAELKRRLRAYGISAFVAHEDIEPTLEWQSELQLALTTAHSLAALLTPDFHESRWTDQEVGIAIGRGLFVFGVQLPTAPYGFLGKTQGLRGDLANASQLAQAIFAILLQRSETEEAMREGLVTALETSANFADSNQLIPIIVGLRDFTSGQRKRMYVAMMSNSQVAGAYAVGSLRHYLRELGTGAGPASGPDSEAPPTRS